MMTLTREQIEAMEAGRELDGAIAQSLFGWTPPGNGTSDWRDERGGRRVCTLAFSSDIAAAWRVVDVFLAKPPIDGREFSVQYDVARRDWIASFSLYRDHDGNYEEALAPTAPLAICRGALLALASQQHGRPDAAGKVG